MVSRYYKEKKRIKQFQILGYPENYQLTQKDYEEYYLIKNYVIQISFNIIKSLS